MCQESKKPSDKDTDIREDGGGIVGVGDEEPSYKKWGNPPRPSDKPRGEKDPKPKDTGSSPPNPKDSD